MNELFKKEYPSTFREWMKQQFDHNHLEDLLAYDAEHAYDDGKVYIPPLKNCFPLELYDQYHNEIWDRLEFSSTQNSTDNIMEFLPFILPGNVKNDTQFKTALVFFLCREIGEELLHGGE